MSKKIMVLVWILLCLAGLSGVGYGVWRQREESKKQEHIGVLASSKAKTQQQSSNQGISLSSVPGSNTKSGLSVDTNSQAANLGQIGGTQNSQSGSSGTPKSSQPTIDPSKFGEYEKYKDAQNGLFGEMQVGTGAEAVANKKVAVYYKGWLTNGQLFDQTKTDKDGKPQPFIFTLGAGEVIPGWEQGIAGMKAGGTRLIIVPPAVGYGAQGQGPIPPNSVMVFQVQLLAVE